MVKVFYKEILGKRLVPLVYSYRDPSAEQNENVPYIKESLKEVRDHFVERVDSPEEADYLIIPYTLKHVRNDTKYIEDIRSLAKQHDKRIVVFAFEDHYVAPEWPEAIVFRASDYKSEMKPNELGLPYIVQDVLQGGPIKVRKRPAKPVVGFVGWARFDSFVQELRSRVRNALNMVSLFLRGHRNLGVRRKGLLLRAEMIRVLERDGRLITNFIIRDNYGGNVKTALDPAKSREEFINNIVESDLVFCPRGEGNASQRFFETLSFGRIPLVIDTDIDFPLESVIPYERFVIKVPYNDRKNTGAYVERFFASLDNESYAERQKEARYYFEKYLSLSGFYSFLFQEEKIKDLVESL